MSISRIYTTLNNLIIRTLGDTGGPSSSRVDEELNNIITGVNNIEDGTTRISGVRYAIKIDTSTVGNVGAGLDTLHTFSLPAGSLATNGDYLSIWYSGGFANNDTNKRVNAVFDGTTYENTGTVDIDGGAWELQARIVRLTDTSVRASHTLRYFAIHADSASPPVVTTFATGFFSVTRNASFSVADLDANAITMTVQGEGAANDDVTQTLSIIELVQQ